MSDISEIYNEWFFEEIKKSEVESSMDFAKIVQKYLKFNSVMDVGCGSAIYLKALNDIGITDLIGFDGSECAVTTSLLPDVTFVHDLRLPLILDRKYDLAICIEVAEHLEEKYAETLVKSLIGVSDCVLFTAATVNQGGYGHLFEVEHEYWIDLFARCGYKHDKELSDIMRQEMYAKNVVWWICKNTMIFNKI